MPINLRTFLGNRVVPTAPITTAKFVSNVGSMGRMRGTAYSISPSFFSQMRELAADFKDDSTKVMYAIDRSVAGYAAVCLGFAQQRSRGFLDPREQNPQWAWKIPVRRISGRYLTGWRVQHVGLGNWRTYNASREAYFIEFGINHKGTGLTSPAGGSRVRIRRPILKLSVMDTIAFVRGKELDWLEFRGAFALSSHHSPITGMSKEAAHATVAAGQEFVVGAINTPM